MLSNIYKHSKKYLFASLLLLCLSITLVACGDTTSAGKTTGNTQTGGTSGSSTSGTTTAGTASVSTAVTSIPGTPGIGPVVILSPTPVPGGGSHSQQVVLSDRTLVINDVTKSAGANAGSVTITISLDLKNTSSKAIMNQSAYYLLTSSEGDSFGVTSSATSSFYGAINANSSHSGTIVFQVPSAAVTGLHLMYHPEVATETTFIPLSL